MSDQEFAERVVVVTGAAQGIGYSICRHFLKAGAVVAMVDVDEEANRVASKELEGLGGEPRPYCVDVSSSGQVDDLLAAVVRDCGVPDAIVNNAATNRPAMLHKMSDDEWNFVIGVNLSGVFFMTRAAARVMIPRKTGSIVNVTALAALRGALGQVNYVSAKAGIVGTTKASARELARHKIRVNAVAPGVVRTRMSEKILTDERFRDQYVNEIPLGRVAEPEDIARVVYFLASDNSSYMTGQVLNVSGGTYM